MAERNSHIISEIEIDNFRPRVSFAGQRIIYLSSSNEKIINEYLEASTSEELSNKYSFPAKYVNLFMDIYSYPKISTIVFDQSCTKAEIFFLTHPYGGIRNRFSRHKGVWNVDEGFTEIVTY